MGPETSPGIRPLLIDLEGVPRDEDGYQPQKDEATVESRVSRFLEKLQTINALLSSKNAFMMDRNSFEPPTSILKECGRLDVDLWEAQCLDWFDLVKRQRSLAKNFDVLSEQIRKAEMEASIQAASPDSLVLVKERLERLSRDREMRFEVLKDMVEDVCAREMNWKIVLQEPAKDTVLALASTSVVGLVGTALENAGEPLPIG